MNDKLPDTKKESPSETTNERFNPWGKEFAGYVYGESLFFLTRHGRKWAGPFLERNVDKIIKRSGRVFDTDIRNG